MTQKIMRWKSFCWKMALLFVLVALIFVWLIRAQLASSYLTNKLGVPVSIRSFSVWPTTTTIRDFKVSNPRGFKNKVAFEAQNITINYRFRALFGNPCEIDQIEIDGITLNIICSNPLCSSNNWTAMGESMPDQGKKSSRRVMLHKLILSNMKARIDGFGFESSNQTKQVDHWEYGEIDSDAGFPTSALIKEIFEGFGLDQYIRNVFGPKGPIKFLPGLFGDVGIEK